MRIVKIQVKELYEQHDYNIDFDEDNSIKIIHAPNGYGKTTLLKLIDCIIAYKLVEISYIPFKSFLIYFDNQTSLEVVKSSESQKFLLSYIIKEGEKTEVFEIEAIRKISDTNGFWIQPELKLHLQKIKDQMPTYLIDANRLFKMNMRDQIPSVLIYAKELSRQMQSVLAESAKLNQELDRTFPVRLISRMKIEEYLASDKVEAALLELEKRRLELEEIGLLTSSGEGQVLAALKEAEVTTLKVLTLYIEDSYRKLEIFDGIATRLHMMKEMINRYFAYKSMCISANNGFTFKTARGQILSADKLSSGEQNELVLIYELLFKSPPHALILIDEPEISLHIAWQQNFLEDMEYITALTDLRIIIATHSPDIINGRWDITTGLEEC